MIKSNIREKEKTSLSAIAIHLPTKYATQTVDTGLSTSITEIDWLSDNGH
jgi:hypothetical protein